MNNSYFVSPRFKGPPGQEDMPYLLTPGPVTTSRGVKTAMLADYGVHDADFRSMIGEVRRDLKRLGGGDETHECILLSGSEAVAAESVLAALAPTKRKKVLIAGTGKSALHAVQTLDALGRANMHIESASAGAIAAALDGAPEVSHVWVSHCDADTGTVVPLEDIGAVVFARGKQFIVDASHSFAALPLDMVKDKIDVLVAGSSSCLESVPGLAFILIKRDLLIASDNKSNSPVFDILAEWQAQESNNMLRHTPPSHSIVALRQSLRELDAEGGIGMRRARYQNNAMELITRMRAMGFTPLLADSEAGPIVQCFRAPRDSKFVFSDFAEHLRQRGFVISPGANDGRKTFRVGCIGQVNDKVIKVFSRAVEDTLKIMDIQEFNPVDA